MSFNRRLDALRLHADVPLCGGCAAVLQEPLHQGDVVPAALVDYLIYNDPLAYAELILNGDPEVYLKTVTEYKPLD